MTQQAIPAGYKLTEVGVIPTDWFSKSLENISGFITKGSTPTTYGYKWEQCGILFLRSECVSEKGLDLTQSMFISPAAHKALHRSEICNGDILVTITGNVGRVIQLSNVPCANMNQHIAKVRISSTQVDREYVYYFLSQPSVRKHFNTITTGLAYPQISLKQVREALVLFPPTLSEQSHIATVLSDMDKLITQLDELIAKKKAIKQGAMQLLLVPKKDWEVKTIEEFEKLGLIKLMRGKVISKKDIDGNSGNYPIYSSSIHNNGLFGSYGQYMFDEELITWSVDGGGNFFYRPKHRFSVTNVCGYMRVDTTKINYAFLAVQLQLLHGRLFFDYTLKAHPSIIRKAYAVGIPDIKEQIHIATILSDMDQEIQQLEEKKAKYEQTKQGAMQQLLTGKIRLK